MTTGNLGRLHRRISIKTGDIILFPAPEKEDHAELNLILELKKGAHYYDIPKIQQQVTRAPLSLLNNMKRFFLDELHPIPDRSPKVTRHFQAMIQDAFDGTMRPGDYSAELWKQLAPAQKEVQAELKKLGGLVSITLVESKSENGNRDYRYLVEFKKARVLQHFVLDSRNKVALIQSESAELKLEPR